MKYTLNLFFNKNYPNILDQLNSVETSFCPSKNDIIKIHNSEDFPDTPLFLIKERMVDYSTENDNHIVVNLYLELYSGLAKENSKLEQYACKEFFSN